MVGRCQQPLHLFFPAVGAGVPQESLTLARGGRQARQVQTGPGQQGGVRCPGRQGQPLCSQASNNKPVDRVFARAWGGHRECSPDRGFKGPVLAPQCPLGDPLLKQFFLPFIQRFAMPGRRHQGGFFQRTDATDQLAASSVAWNHRPRCRGRPTVIQAQVALAVFFVRSVAREAMLRKDGKDIPAKAGHTFSPRPHRVPGQQHGQPTQTQVWYPPATDPFQEKAHAFTVIATAMDRNQPTAE